MVYLLHFDRPMAHAQHYLGWCHDDDLERRVGWHKKGTKRAARICQVAVSRGIALSLVRTWPGAGRRQERSFKDGSHGKRLCPLCRAARKERWQ